MPAFSKTSTVSGQFATNRHLKGIFPKPFPSFRSPKASVQVCSLSQQFPGERALNSAR